MVIFYCGPRFDSVESSFFFLSLFFFPSLSLSARLKSWQGSILTRSLFLYHFSTLFSFFCTFPPSFFCPPLMSSSPFSPAFPFFFLSPILSHSFSFLFFFLFPFFLPLSAAFLSLFPHSVTVLVIGSHKGNR